MPEKKRPRGAGDGGKDLPDVFEQSVAAGVDEKLTEPYQVEHAQELVQTEMLEDIAEHARLLLCDMCTQMTQALQLCNEPDGPQAYAKTLEADLTQLQQAENLQGYLQVQTFLNGLVFGKLSPIRKFSGDVKKRKRSWGSGRM